MSTPLISEAAVAKWLRRRGGHLRQLLRYRIRVFERLSHDRGSLPDDHWWPKCLRSEVWCEVNANSNSDSHPYAYSDTDADTNSHCHPTLLPEPTPTPPPFVLTATGHVVNGTKLVRLAWTGATSDYIYVVRNGHKIAEVPNRVGLFTDTLTSAGVYTYAVREVGGLQRIFEQSESEVRRPVATQPDVQILTKARALAFNRSNYRAFRQRHSLVSPCISPAPAILDRYLAA